MDAGFMAKLEAARSECMFPWEVNAGYRTAEHNVKLGGAHDSWHLQGKAADIACSNGIMRYAIVQASIQADIAGIEVCNGHIHLDDRPYKCMWPGVDK